MSGDVKRYSWRDRLSFNTIVLSLLLRAASLRAYHFRSPGDAASAASAFVSAVKALYDVLPDRLRKVVDQRVGKGVDELLDHKVWFTMDSSPDETSMMFITHVSTIESLVEVVDDYIKEINAKIDVVDPPPNHDLLKKRDYWEGVKKSLVGRGGDGFKAREAVVKKFANVLRWSYGNEFEELFERGDRVLRAIVDVLHEEGLLLSEGYELVGEV